MRRNSNIHVHLGTGKRSGWCLDRKEHRHSSAKANSSAKGMILCSRGPGIIISRLVQQTELLILGKARLHAVCLGLGYHCNHSWDRFWDWAYTAGVLCTTVPQELWASDHSGDPASWSRVEVYPAEAPWEETVSTDWRGHSQYISKGDFNSVLSIICFLSPFPTSSPSSIQLMDV